ncbi:MAG: DUF1580 domain-containing protein [Aureliella sp.]
MKCTATKEKLYPLVEAVELETGIRPHLTTCLRWSSRGSRGIRLETCILGGRRLTSREAVRRYIDATTEARDGATPAPIETPAQQDRAAVRAAKQLADRLNGRV